jgi:hypothetical protein
VRFSISVGVATDGTLTDIHVVDANVQAEAVFSCALSEVRDIKLAPRQTATGPDYLLFERARELREAGLAARVLVPVPRDENTSEWQGVALATTELLAKLARVGTIELIPIREVEPISLNAARDVLRFIERERIHSVLVVSPVFRSRRSALVYGSTLGQAGVIVNCEPVQGLIGVDNWGSTWHGIQNVVEQWGKLQYYRFYVLKFRLHGTEQPSR